MKYKLLGVCCLSVMVVVACRPSRPEMTDSNTYVDSIVDSDAVVTAAVPADSMATGVKEDSAAADAQKEAAIKKEAEKRVFARSEDGYVNVRLKPTVSSDTLGRLLVGGESAIFLGVSGEWYHVRYHGKEGYVKSVYAVVDSTGKYDSKKPENIK